MKNVKYVLLSVSIAMLLVGCNTGEENTTSQPTPEIPNTTPTPQQEPIVDNTQQPVEQPSENIEVEEPVAENELTYVRNNQEVTEATTVVKSDNQSFQLALLPEFTLVAEEPGKDVVLYDEDERVSMRIETVALADSTFNDMLQATKDFMNAGSSNGETVNDTEVTALAPASAKNVAAFRNDYEGEIAVSLLFETENFYVRLTVFDVKDIDLTEAMLKMGATIAPIK